MPHAIVILDAADGPPIEAHLLRLSPGDRSLRFAAGLVTDDTVRGYVGRIRHGHDIVLGLLDRDDRLVGLAHGCVYEARGQLHVEAAFSIDEGTRGQGFGIRLMQAVQIQAQARGIVRVVGSCAVRNLPMRRVFERAGLTLKREDDEMCAEGGVAAPDAGQQAAAGLALRASAGSGARATGA
jgi:GNAT superfamily N-acetyltransferase